MKIKHTLLSITCNVCAFAFFACGGGSGGNNGGGGGGNNNLTPPEAPAAPVLTAGSGNITANWNAVTGADSYEVYYNTADDSSIAEEFDEGDKTDAGCLITGLVDGTVYYVWIKAVNSAGSSDFSQSASCMTLQKVLTPVFSPVAGDYMGKQIVSITTSTGGASIYYTIDGTNPDNSSTLYTASFEIWSSKTIKAIAVKDGLVDSDIATGEFNLAFSFETIASEGDTGYYTSIGIDSNNKTHIAYCYGSGLVYITNKNSIWEFTELDLFCLEDLSLAIDSADNVHIAYKNWESGQYLKHTTNASGSWVSEIIDTTGAGGQSVSMAIDDSDNIYITYIDYDGSPGLRCAVYDGSSWSISAPIDTSSTWPSTNTSVAVDSAGKIHIGYQTDTNTIKYATDSSGSWVSSQIYSGFMNTEGTAIAVDENDEDAIYLAYESNAGLRCSVLKEEIWQHEIIDNRSGTGTMPSMAIDADSVVHICYYAGEGLGYATNKSGSWEHYDIDTTLEALYSSITLDSAGKAHISYCDYKYTTAWDCDLEYAKEE